MGAAAYVDQMSEVKRGRGSCAARWAALYTFIELIDSHRWHASSRTAPLLLLHRPLHRPCHIRPAILSCTIAESAVARAREYSSTCQTSPSYPTFMRMRPTAGAVGAPWFRSGRRRSENQLFTVFTLAEEKFRKSRSPKSNRHLSLNE